MALYGIPEYPVTMAGADAFNNDIDAFGRRIFRDFAVGTACGCRNSIVRAMVCLSSCPSERFCAAHTPCTASHS